MSIYFTNNNGTVTECKNLYEINNHILNESVIISGKVDKKRCFHLECTPDATRNLGAGGGYFKWFDGSGYNKSKNIARIRFGAAEYVDNHRNRGGHKNTTLDREQKEALVKSLKKPIEQYKLEDIDTELCKYIHDGWTYLIYMNNSFCGFSDDAMIEAMNSGDIPKNMAPLDYPMPNYLLL